MYQQTNPNEMPGIGTTIVAVYKPIWKGRGGVQYLPGGGTIDGNNARDPANVLAGSNLPNVQTSYTNVLEPGLLMGKITASGFYGAAVFGLTTVPLGGGQTTLSVAAAVAAEIARRIGQSGTLTLTGPNVSGGTVRSRSITFSAVNTSTGAITISADALASVSAVNAVEALPFVDSTGSGTFTLTIEGITTGAITYSATAATLVANINTALNAAFGTSAIVASGATLAALILTFSGTGYAGRPINTSSNGTVFGVKVIATLLTGATGFTVGNNPTSSGVGAALAGGSTTTTAGVAAASADEGEFIASSLVQPADGSQVIKTFVDEEDGIRVTDINGNGLNIQFPRVPIGGGVVNSTNIVNYPSDPSLQAWVKSQLNVAGTFMFGDNF